jgi:hypothetical protein
MKLIWNSGEEPSAVRREAKRAAARQSGSPSSQPYYEHVMDTAARRLRTMFEQGDIEGAVQLIRAAQELRRMLRDTAEHITGGVNQPHHGTYEQLRRLQVDIVSDPDRMFKQLLTRWQGDPFRPKR